MLEDSNMLVYIEAFRTVELLVQVLGHSTLILKPKKVKQYVGLLADKYKETKSSVVSAVNKALSTVFSCYLHFTFVSSTELLLSLLATGASSQKNPRVRHLILEKIASMVDSQSVNGTSSEGEILSIAKTAKDKLLSLVAKDTSANVRDSAVTLILALKCKLPVSPQVNEIIKGLPKNRQMEVQKRLEDWMETVQPERTANRDLAVVASNEYGKGFEPEHHESRTEHEMSTYSHVSAHCPEISHEKFQKMLS